MRGILGALAAILVVAGCDRRGTTTLPQPTTPPRVDTITVERPGPPPRVDTLIVTKHDTTVVVQHDTVTIVHTDTVRLSALPSVLCITVTMHDTLLTLSHRDSPYCAAAWQSKFVDSSKIHVVMDVDTLKLQLPPNLVLPAFLKR